MRITVSGLYDVKKTTIAFRKEKEESIERLLQEKQIVPEIGIFVDFGSTYTKVTAIDLDDERIIGQGRSESTVKTDLTIGLKTAFRMFDREVQKKCLDTSHLRLACSSAAGGLRLVVIGLVPSLSLSAGKMAALGAGAKLVGNYSYKLNQSEIKEITDLAPDIILLVGGTDGGNEQKPESPLDILP